MEKDKEWLKEEINKVTSRIYGADFNTIKETDDLINQLEEPQQEKVVVPQFAADWYEEHKKTLDYGIYWLCIGNQQFIDGKSSELTEIGKWFHETKGAILILCSMKNGYEVEKEKLYRVKVDQGPNYLYVESLHLYKDVVEPLDFNHKFSPKEYALKFTSRNQAKGVAELVGGEVEEVTK